ncbi:S-layer glycoprotein N-glycosyltransferase AglJ [Ferroglobus sp.]|uniref:S-layer glycoprotein N-glycosyltransferase AglJ n=1 Tax=Ferroglobus sp. TaxID=2614230 RepID=UPI0025BEC4E7|nr:S-layer glycoprotein N-glycosyltransferase AglJ [Ferroglobus sp.]
MKVTVIIPTLNEEESIGEIVEKFVGMGYEVFVIDGNSTDKTREIAKEKGAKVVVQSGKGKGQAVKEAFQLVDSDVVVLIDGDGTYLPEEVEKLLEPIRRDVADHVAGNRLENFEKGAFTRLNLLGNKILNLFFRLFYGVELYDILTGYRAMKKEVYKSFELEKTGFEIEAEMTVETIANGFRILEVPITYKKRKGRTKLRPIKDGVRIALTLYSLLKKYSPGRYFYFIGGLLLFLGLITGAITVYDWFRKITHYLLAVLTALLIISGLQMILIGVISDVLVRNYATLKRDIENLRREVRESRRDS